MSAYEFIIIDAETQDQLFVLESPSADAAKRELERRGYEVVCEVGHDVIEVS
jgi:transposase